MTIPAPTAATGPTLLPATVASVISLFSKSTSVSIRLGTMVGATLLDTARTGTMTSLELSRAAVEGIVRRGGRGVVARRGHEAELEGWATKGLTAFNTSITLTELILSTAFELGQTTLSSISGIAETYVLTLDSIFGSTETSRAISEIVKLIREEFKDSSEHDGEVGMKDIVVGLTCFAILQYRHHTRLDADSSMSGRLMWDVVVDAPIPASATVGHEGGSSSSSSTTTTTTTTNTGDFMEVDRDANENMLPSTVFDSLPSNAEISVTTTSTTTSTTTIEVVGTSPPDFTLPPGAVVLSESSHQDGRPRYKIVYETVTRNEQSKRLRREDGGDIAVMDDDDNILGDKQRVFEIYEPKSPTQKPGGKSVGGGPARKRTTQDKQTAHKRRELKAQEPHPSNSDTDPPRPVPKKTKIASTIASGKPCSATANQPKKRAVTSPSSKKGKEQENDRETRSTPQKALLPAVSFSKDKKTPPPLSSRQNKNQNDKHIMTAPHRTSSAFNNMTIQTTPKLTRSRRPSIASRSTSPDLRYGPRPSSRSTFHHHESSFSSTASSSHHDGYGYHSQTNLHSAYSPRTTPDGPLSRRTSTISLDGDFNQSQKHSHVPSIYTLHTTHSTASLHLLYTPPTSENPGRCYPTDFHLLYNLRKYIRFASASYGAQFMRLLLGSQFSPMPVAERSHHLEHQAFSFHTSLPVDTILLSSHYDPSGGFDSAGHTGTGRPLVHFVCVDHEAAAIVVTCRGTLGLEDVLTDLTCEYTSIILRGCSYRVHKGMYNSAALLLRSRLLSNLAAALQSYPDYGLILTGHSLGGGVAALVSILIAAPNENGVFVTAHDALPLGRPVHCYAFGSPAIVCEPLRIATRGLVTTVVNGNDVVPTLSIGVIRDFHSVALSFREDTGEVLGEIRRRFLRGMWAGPNTSEDEWNWEVAVLKTLRAGMTAEKLVPPGEVWRVLRESACARGARGEVIVGAAEKTRVRAWVVEDVESRFGEIMFAKSCFGDHSPGAYEETLEGLRRGVLDE